MKIQLDIPYELNKALKMERVANDIPNMQELILIILKERYEVKEDE
jgi:hypothetical protein